MIQKQLAKPWVRNLVIFLIGFLILSTILGMRQVLAPVFIALAIAYVGDPVIDKFEEWRISRTFGIVILIVLLSLTLTALLLYLVPKLIFQLQELGELLPKYMERMREKFLPQLETYIKEHPNEINELRDSAIEWLKTHSTALLTGVTTGLARSFRSVGLFLSNVVGLVLIPVLTFYLLRDFDIMKERVVELIPRQKKRFIVNLFIELDATMGNFIKGQLLVALILAVIYSVGLTIAGCPGSLLIGCIAGLANLVPYLGLALGFVPAVLLTYLTGNPLWQVAFAALTFVLGQMLEGMVITPKIVGDTVGLHPALVLIALMIGGSYFGMVGMILAVPVAAIIMVFARRTHQAYVRSVLYHEDEPDESEQLNDGTPLEA